MQKIRNDSLIYINFDIFKKLEGFYHAFSTRLGGVSQGYFKELNLSFSSGDDKQCVFNNYKILCDALDIRPEDIVLVEQVHKSNIHHATKLDRGKGIIRPTDIKETDAIITNVAGVTLGTFYADCVPLYFIDAINNVVAVAHAGWRGTVSMIAKKVVDEMHNVYGSQYENILAAIGPSICVNCFEVDEPVYNEFVKLNNVEKYITKTTTEKYNIDLQNINRNILLDCGLKIENIEIANICTKCNTDLFYSHRVMGKERGNMIALIGIREN